jgi:hypothetical protein
VEEAYDENEGEWNNVERGGRSMYLGKYSDVGK